MFSSIEYSCPTFNLIQLHIYDSDFWIKYIEKEKNNRAAMSVMAESIIDIYSEKNLNVSKNLFLYMRYIEKRYYWISISHQISVYNDDVKEFHKYYKEMQKYLLFT